MKIFHVIFLFCILFSGCKKDCEITPTPLNNDCKSLPITPKGNGWIIKTDVTVNKYSGFIDPYDPNIIYYLVDRDAMIPGAASGILVKENLISGIKILMDSSIITTPVINKFGWLLYNKLDLNIYKIKTNGDSLTKLTTDNNNIHPYWDYTGFFIYFLKSGGLAYKMNNKGVYTDTLKYTSSVIFPSKISNKILYVVIENSQSKLILKNLDDNSIKQLYSQNDLYKLPFFDNSDESVYWYNKTGLYKTNINTLETNLILKSYETAEFNYFVLNSNYIFATREAKTPLDEYKLNVQRDLYKINIDGSNPIKIVIP